MNDNLSLSFGQRAAHLFTSDKRGHLIGILAVLLPFAIVALIGSSLGTDTSAASGLVVTLAYLLAIVIATVVLKLQGSGWHELGLAQPKSWRKTIVLGLGAMVAFVVAMFVVETILTNIPGLALPPSDQSDYNPLVGNLPLFLTMVAAAWTSVAFGEEMLFRAFLTVNLAGALSNLSARWPLALIGSSLLFGMAHFDWGPAGMIDTFIMGFVLGFIYIRSGRNLWITIIAHALANTIKFSLLYAGMI